MYMKTFMEMLHAFGSIFTFIPQFLLGIAAFLIIPFLISALFVFPTYFTCYLPFKKKLDSIEPFNLGWGIPSFQGTLNGKTIRLEYATSKSGTRTLFTYECQPSIHFELRSGKTGGINGLHPPYWTDCPHPFPGHVYKTDDKPAFTAWLAQIAEQVPYNASIASLQFNYYLASLQTNPQGVRLVFRCYPSLDMLDYAQALVHFLELTPQATATSA